jgi:hypothetical protein
VNCDRAPDRTVDMLLSESLLETALAKGCDHEWNRSTPKWDGTVRYDLLAPTVIE